jgi:hypothetical protein
MKFDHGSCPDVIGGSQAAMWTVNQDAQGGYTVSVQGDDKMPVLWGGATGSDVTLTGLTDEYPSQMTQWKLSGSNSSVTGRAVQARSTKVTRPASAAPKSSGRSLFGGSAASDSERSALCSVEWTVEATKQGK